MVVSIEADDRVYLASERDRRVTREIRMTPLFDEVLVMFSWKGCVMMERREGRENQAAGTGTREV